MKGAHRGIRLIMLGAISLSCHAETLKVEDREMPALNTALKLHFTRLASRCTPKLLVLSDNSTGDYNPFFRELLP